jgi:hypothetical protein
MSEIHPISMFFTKLSVFHSVLPRGWRNKNPGPRVGGGGVWPKAKKKKVTSLILMAEVVGDVPKGTSDHPDGSPAVQDVFELP